MNELHIMIGNCTLRSTLARIRRDFSFAITKSIIIFFETSLLQSSIDTAYFAVIAPKTACDIFLVEDVVTTASVPFWLSSGGLMLALNSSSSKTQFLRKFISDLVHPSTHTTRLASFNEPFLSIG